MDEDVPSPGDVLAVAMGEGPLPRELDVSDAPPPGVPAHAARHALWATAGDAFRAALAFQGALLALPALRSRACLEQRRRCRKLLTTAGQCTCASAPAAARRVRSCRAAPLP